MSMALSRMLMSQAQGNGRAFLCQAKGEDKDFLVWDLGYGGALLGQAQGNDKAFL